MARRLAPMHNGRERHCRDVLRSKRRRTLQVRIHGASAHRASALNDAVADPSSDRLPRCEQRIDVVDERLDAGGPALHDLDPSGVHEPGDGAADGRLAHAELAGDADLRRPGDRLAEAVGREALIDG
jgi:hypothetical protein